MSRRLALIIGNSEYKDTNLAQLVTPGKDAEGFAKVLEEVAGFEVMTHINKPFNTVRLAIARFFKQKKPNDLLLLYFSGHGVRDRRGKLYLAVKDTEHDLLSGSAISAAFITEEMDDSRSKRQVLILDCCHSGAFAHGAKSGTSVGTATAFEGTGYGRVVLTATDATQYAWEGDQVIGEAENSVFTHYMIHGLRTFKADLNKDGQITLDELYDYVYEKIVSQKAKQTPGKWTYKQQGDILIARRPRSAVKIVELPPELRQAIGNPFAGVRAGAVQELDRLLRSSDQKVARVAYEALRGLAEDDNRQVSAAAASVLGKFAPIDKAPVRVTAPTAKPTDIRGLKVDSGALKAMRAGANLLPVGVLGVVGRFDSGSEVSLYNEHNQLVAAGRVEYGSKDINEIKGRHSSEIETILGSYFGDSVISNASLHWVDTDTSEGRQNGLIVDSGALKAMRAGASLLPVGILGVVGRFNSGSEVSLYNEHNQLVATGRVEYGSKDINKIKGRHSSEIETILGNYFGDSVILNASLHWNPK